MTLNFIFLSYIKINGDLTCLYFPFDNISVHPTEILPVVPYIRGYSKINGTNILVPDAYNISFDIQFKKVYPKPLCRATLGVSMCMLILLNKIIPERNFEDICYKKNQFFYYFGSNRKGAIFLFVLWYILCKFKDYITFYTKKLLYILTDKKDMGYPCITQNQYITIKNT